MNYTKHLITLAVAGIVALSACKKNNIDAPDNGKDIDLTATELQKVDADNQFSIKLFRNVALNSSYLPDNVFISPLSVSFAMAMVANGANTATLDSVRHGMNFDAFTEAQVNTYYNKLITGLPLVDSKTTLNIANSVWYDQNLSVQQQFLQTNKQYYKSDVQSLDFNSPAALTQINNWVSNKTNGKIPTIIDQIPANAMLYLVNAVYFKSMWDQKFDAAKTSKRTFYLASNSTLQTDFMQGDNMNINAAVDGTTNIIELPYHNNKYSMVIVKPVDTTKIKNIVASLTPQKWNTWISNLHHTTATVNLPKFKFGYAVDLKDILKSYTMNIAFGDNADFSRITGSKGLKINEVKHKGYVDVNEDGTEAAAVTAVGFTTTSAPMQIITFDHPFIFAIREVKTGLVLFMGVMNNPQLSNL